MLVEMKAQLVDIGGKINEGKARHVGVEVEEFKEGEVSVELQPQVGESKIDRVERLLM